MFYKCSLTIKAGTASLINNNIRADGLGSQRIHHLYENVSFRFINLHKRAFLYKRLLSFLFVYAKKLFVY